MALTGPQTGTTKVIRKRKAHTKSRRGCGNCKLRRVKCDETKPSCKRCLAFAVSCSYDGKTDLEPSMESTFSIEVPIPINAGYHEAILSFATSPDAAASTASEESEFDADDFKTLERFRNRTVYSLGTENSAELYRRELVRLAKEHALLFHLLVTVTLMHDRFLIDVRQETPMPPTEAEAYHWYQGTAIFNSKLRELYSITGETERDAMWGGAVALGCSSFFMVEGDRPEDVWPLKPPSSLDLDWLKLSDGKREIWRVADPLRPESAWASLALEQVHMLHPHIEEPPLLDEFHEMWGKEPYRHAACTLGQIMPLECTRRTILHFLSFIASARGGFMDALVQRDPRAMLLLGVWYAKMCAYRQWWTMRRSVLESQAIVLYLERNHADLAKGLGRDMIEFVRKRSGLQDGWTWRDFAREAGMASVISSEEVGELCQRGGKPWFSDSNHSRTQLGPF